MGDCCDGICGKCLSMKYIVFGIIVLATVMYKPDKIWHVLGILLILKGILKMVKPTCGHCTTEPAKKGKK